MNNTRFSWDSVSKITEPHTSEPLKINLLLQYPDSEECKMNVAQILRDIGPEYDSLDFLNSLVPGVH